MTDLVTNVIRDKDGKLVATYETVSGRGSMPRDIALKYSTATESDFSNPNYAGNVFALKPGYTMESIKSVDPSNYYKTEIAQGLPERDAKIYSQKLESIKKEASQRRLEEQNRIETATRNRESAIANANAQSKILSHTTNNPFVSPGAREISRRKTVSALDSLNSTQFALGEAIDSYNSLTFQGSFEDYERTQQQREQASKGVNTFGGKDNRFVDYRSYRPPVKTTPILDYNVRKASQDVEKYQNRNYVPQQFDLVVGNTGYDIAEKPRQMTRAQQTEYNQSLINAQRSILNPFQSIQASPPVQTNTIQRATAQERFQVTTTNGKIRTFNTKEGAEKFVKNFGGTTTRYQVTTPDNRQRTFTTKEGAEKFGARYGNAQVGPSSIQGPPKPSDTAFFVGANYQGYTMDVQRPKEPKLITASGIFGDNILTKNFDAFFELNKPVKQRSTINQGLEGATRPASNIIESALLAPEAFKRDVQNRPSVTEFFGSSPIGQLLGSQERTKGQQYFESQQTQKPTASSEIFSGKIPNLLDPAIAGSAVTEGGLLALGLKSGSLVSKPVGAVQTAINKAKVTKVFSGLESPKVLTSGKVTKTGPSFPNSGEFTKSTYAKNKFGETEVLRAGKITVKPVKGRPDLFKIESSNPLQDKSVFGQVTKGKVTIKTIEPETGLTTPERVRIRTNPNDVFGIEINKFDLVKTGKGIYETSKPVTGKSQILKATQSSAVQPVARAREFRIEDILENPKEFSRYLFQETTVGKTPARPISDVLLAETKSYQTVGTKLQLYPKRPDTIPTRSKSNVKVKSEEPDIFKPFTESNVSTPKSKFDRFGIFGRNKFKKKQATDTFVSDLLQNIKEIDPFADMRRFTRQGKRASSYSQGKFSIDDDIDPSRPTSQTLTYSKKNIEAQVKEDSITQDILFGKPRNLIGFGFSNELFTDQPQRIKDINQLSQDMGLGIGTKTKRPYGFDMININESKLDSIQTQFPINVNPTKEKERNRLSPIIVSGLASSLDTGLTQVPITTQTPITTTRLDQILVPDIVPITTQTPEPIPEIFGSGFRLGVFGTGFPGFGGGSGGGKRPKRFRKKYIVNSIDPLNPGSIITAGLPVQRVSSSKKIYDISDRALTKQRKRNNPQRRSKNTINPFKTKSIF